MRSMRQRREGDMRLHVSEGDMRRVESVEWCLPHSSQSSLPHSQRPLLCALPSCRGCLTASGT
jgi:hypothetical protein